MYVSSELHRRGDASLDDLNWKRRSRRGNQAYSDTRVHMALLACAVARRWPQARSKSLEPGWVATRIGGPRATGDLQAAHLTQAWLATGEDPHTEATDGYFLHMHPKRPSGAVFDVERQDRLLAACERLSGVAIPE